MKLHIMMKRGNPHVFCSKSVGYFNKVVRYEVAGLLKRHGTEKYFCARCLRKWKSLIRVAVVELDKEE